MKHVLTIIQVMFWIIADAILFLFYLEWNRHLKKTGHSFKKENGIVKYASNYDLQFMKQNRNKYSVAFSLK